LAERKSLLESAAMKKVAKRRISLGSAKESCERWRNPGKPLRRKGLNRNVSLLEALLYEKSWQAVSSQGAEERIGRA